MTFYRFRHQVVYTDSAQALTHGNPAGPMALLAHLNPTLGVYTSIDTAADGQLPLIGQMQYTAGERSARIAFLMPEDGLNQPSVSGLMDDMAVQAGSWGAFHMLAEVEETSCALEGLRRSGFSVYAWQRIWQFDQPGERPSNGSSNGKNEPALWQPASSVDEVTIRSLYQSLVPPLVQSAEPLEPRRLSGWVYRQEGEIMAYVEGIYGPNGVYLQPLIHPAMENVSQALSHLMAQRRIASRPAIYISIRSYQAWLETVLRDLPCEVGPRQALMVKHLVVQQRAAVQTARHSVLEKITAEPTVPLVHNSTATNK
ncbi:MAG TPA: hypothetical protein VF806_08975 [Anaerolineaceae bacterium]